MLCMLCCCCCYEGDWVAVPVGEEEGQRFTYTGMHKQAPRVSLWKQDRDSWISTSRYSVWRHHYPRWNDTTRATHTHKVYLKITKITHYLLNQTWDFKVVVFTPCICCIPDRSTSWLYFCELNFLAHFRYEFQSTLSCICPQTEPFSEWKKKNERNTNSELRSSLCKLSV